MEPMRRTALLVVAMGVLATACASAAPPSDPDPAETQKPPSFVSITTASGEPATLYVEVADDDHERAKGLMGVETLPQDEGMAFVWDEPYSGSFWMKDTLIPLSIAFWDTDGRVIAILDMQPCDGEPCPTYGPGEPFIGAVEANLGWFTEHGVELGDHVELEERAYA